MKELAKIRKGYEKLKGIRKEIRNLLEEESELYFELRESVRKYTKRIIKPITKKYGYKIVPLRPSEFFLSYHLRPSWYKDKGRGISFRINLENNMFYISHDLLGGEEIKIPLSQVNKTRKALANTIERHIRKLFATLSTEGMYEGSVRKKILDSIEDKKVPSEIKYGISALRNGFKSLQGFELTKFLRRKAREKATEIFALYEREPEYLEIFNEIVKDVMKVWEENYKAMKEIPKISREVERKVKEEVKKMYENPPLLEARRSDTDWLNEYWYDIEEEIKRIKENFSTIKKVKSMIFELVDKFNVDIQREDIIENFPSVVVVQSRWKEYGRFCSFYNEMEIMDENKSICEEATHYLRDLCTNQLWYGCANEKEFFVTELLAEAAKQAMNIKLPLEEKMNNALSNINKSLYSIESEKLKELYDKLKKLNLNELEIGYLLLFKEKDYVAIHELAKFFAYHTIKSGINLYKELHSKDPNFFKKSADEIIALIDFDRILFGERSMQSETK